MKDVFKVNRVELSQNDDRTRLSYSGLRCFQNCPRAYLHRYVERIEPIVEKSLALRIGSAFHAGLEAYYSGMHVMDRVHADFAAGRGGAEDHINLRRVRAMVNAYMDKYPLGIEPFEVHLVEYEFDGPIVNPETGAQSRTYTILGKVDGLVELDDEYWLLEHKTTSGEINLAYIEKLWTDFQIHLYAYYIEQRFGIKVAGVIYNVARTPSLKYKVPESDEEFEARKAELIAKSKTGKTSATQQTGETLDEYEARLVQWYADNPDAFQRIPHRFRAAKVAEVQGSIWDLTQTLLEARRSGRWNQNPSQCYVFNRPCDYEPLCRSCGDPLIRANYYRDRSAPKSGVEEPAF